MDSILVLNFIKEKFNKDYTRQWVLSLLHRLWFVFKKTKKIPSKSDKMKQEEFIKRYTEIKANLTDKEKIYFIDWVHPMHNIDNQYWWIKKWTEKEIKSNTWRDRININGAYNLENQEAIIIESETINTQSTIELYKKIEKLNPDLKRIYIIRDNARYYNNTLVKEYLLSSRVVEICLPTYSPNLNLIERLWLFFKKRITYNKYYEKFSDFKKAVLDFFDRDILECKDKLKSFISENSMKAIWY
jgi:transposase